MPIFNYDEYTRFEGELSAAEKRLIQKHWEAVFVGNDLCDRSQPQVDELREMFFHGWICLSLFMSKDKTP